jgi:hypothetical protein
MWVYSLDSPESPGVLSSSRFAPERIVYKGNRTPSDRPRSYERKIDIKLNFGWALEYVTSSHYWGVEKVLITTETNFSDFLTNEISWSPLSKTFQEAVKLTRELESITSGLTRYVRAIDFVLCTLSLLTLYLTAGTMQDSVCPHGLRMLRR